MRVVFSIAAQASLRDISRYIARDNKPRAISFARELRLKAIQIGQAPEAYPLLPRFEHKGIRRKPHGNYLIFYRIEAGSVTIINILHAARNVEKLLFPES